MVWGLVFVGGVRMESLRGVRRVGWRSRGVSVVDVQRVAPEGGLAFEWLDGDVG